MIQSEQQRRAYLEALGIDVWVPRGADDEPAPDAAAAVDVAAAPDAVNGESTPASASAVSSPTAADPSRLDWSDLRAAVAGCTRCELSASRTQTVFGVGHEDADWLVVGEAPGAEEDRRGEPFVGRAGKLLDEMLRAVDQDRSRVFIANILKCRPPNNRDPKTGEAGACRGYLDRQIELVKPRIILAVGRIAAQQLLGSDEPVGKLRGRTHQLGSTPVIVTYHPAYLLRSPVQKRKAWQDLVAARRLYRQAVA